MKAFIAVCTVLLAAVSCSSDDGTASPTTQTTVRSPETTESPATTGLPNKQLTPWRLDLGAVVSPDATSFEVLVERSPCRGDGQVVGPEVSISPGRIVVTFAEELPPSGANNCLRTPAEPFTVEVGEPLARRTLVDGYCLQPEPVFNVCGNNGGIRWEAA